MVAQSARTTVGTKKALRVQHAPNGMLEIKWNNGGQLPDVLTGYFTSADVAQEAIVRFNTKGK